MKQYIYLDLYNLNYYSVNSFKSNYSIYRKLKEIPHYFIFTESTNGVKPVIIVKDNNDEIQLFSFNYDAAKNKGVDIVLENPLNDIFDNCSYVYMYDSYDKSMIKYLDWKKEYLQSAKIMLLDEIKRIESEKIVKSYEEKEKLMVELENKINEILNIYDEQLILLNSKLNSINNRISSIEELKQHFNK